MKSTFLFLFVINLNSVVAQVKDTDWFKQPITWEFTSNRGSFQTYNVYNDSWKIDKEFVQETPVVITNRYITIFTGTVMKFEILEPPFMKSYPPQDGNEASSTCTWLKVRDISREIECSIQLIKFKSNGGALGIFYKKNGIGKPLFSTQFILQ